MNLRAAPPADRGHADVVPEQVAIPATWMRGGTSKALFLLESDLPPKGPVRDRVIKRAMGCPDALQIDGIGGARGNTSKVAIVGPSAREDADIEYTFAQVGLAEDTLDYRQTCGNISAAVGPFALAKGLIPASGPTVRIRIYNSNIDDILVQAFQVAAGQARLRGGFVNAGVPGSGAEIFTDYSRSVGRRTGALLPSGRVMDELALPDGRSVRASLIDAGNPAAYVPAEDLGLRGTELPSALLAHPGLMITIGDIRRDAAERMGLGGKFSVRVGLVSPPATYLGEDGRCVPEDSMDVCSRFFALDYCAPNYPGSASVSTGAAARLPGSTVHAVLPEAARRDGVLRIGHPRGVMEVVSALAPNLQNVSAAFSHLGFGRTARTLMDGHVFVPAETFI